MSALAAQAMSEGLAAWSLLSEQEMLAAKPDFLRFIESINAESVAQLTELGDSIVADTTEPLANAATGMNTAVDKFIGAGDTFASSVLVQADAAADMLEAADTMTTAASAFLAAAQTPLQVAAPKRALVNA